MSWTRLLKILKFDETGSAISEFVLVATPLFLPAVLFFNAMHNVATEEMNVSNIARQAVRAFATAPDLATGHQRVLLILDRYSDIESGQPAQSARRYSFTYNIKCGAEQCLEPGSLVELQLFRTINEIEGLPDSKGRKASAVARSYVDKWRDSQ